ncbi:MAG: hypothetical protein E6Q97_20440 [Desulfurellales bacterium]|nr:MAG: hypothetical protein E6Q97_20440 [Desulfurellales bacterium]
MKPVAEEYASEFELAPNTAAHVHINVREPMRMLRAYVTDGCKIGAIRYFGTEVQIVCRVDADVVLHHVDVFPTMPVHIVVENNGNTPTPFRVFLVGFSLADAFVEAPAFARVNRTITPTWGEIVEGPRAALWSDVFGGDLVPITARTPQVLELEIQGAKVPFQGPPVFWVDVPRLDDAQRERLLVLMKSMNHVGDGDDILDVFGFPIPETDLRVVAPENDNMVTA